MGKEFSVGIVRREICRDTIDVEADDKEHAILEAIAKADRLDWEEQGIVDFSWESVKEKEDHKKNFFGPGVDVDEWLEEHGLSAVRIGSEGDTTLDTAIVGILETGSVNESLELVRLVYDHELVIDALIREGMTEEDALEHMDFNIIGSLANTFNEPGMPLIIKNITRWEG